VNASAAGGRPDVFVADGWPADPADAGGGAAAAVTGIVAEFATTIPSTLASTVH